MDLTDHLDPYAVDTQALRSFISPALEAASNHVKKLDAARGMDWIERTKPTARLEAKAKARKKFDWSAKESPAAFFQRKRAFDVAQRL